MITATVETGTGAPRVRVVATDHPVSLVLPDGSAQQVRGSYAEPGEQTVLDFEAPAGVPLTYRNTAGETTGPVVVPDLGMWLVPCAQPDAAVQVLVEKGGVGDWARAEFRDQLNIPGGMPHVTSVRSRGRATTLTVVVLDAADQAALDAALAVGGAFFAQVAAGFWPWRGVAYVDLSEPKQKPVADRSEAWLVEMAVTEVARPAVPQTRPSGWAAMPRTWQGMPRTWAGMPT